MEDADLFGGAFGPENGNGDRHPLCSSAGQEAPLTEKGSRPLRLRNGAFCAIGEPIRAPQLEDYPVEKKLQDETTVLGFPVTAHPMSLYEEELRTFGVVPAKDVHHYAGRTIRVAGWLVTTRRVTTVNKEQMRFLTLEDLTDVVEVVLFPKSYKEYGHLIETFGPYLVTGKVEDDNGYCTLSATRLELL